MERSCLRLKAVLVLAIGDVPNALKGPHGVDRLSGWRLHGSLAGKCVYVRGNVWCGECSVKEVHVKEVHVKEVRVDEVA